MRSTGVLRGAFERKHTSKKRFCEALTTALFALALTASAADGDGNAGSFTDSRDGRKYRTVKIGNQLWMAENLNYKSGESWCYDNDESNCQKYGRLYDWKTAIKACPSGWHLPDTAEWNTLMATVGGVRIDRGGSANVYDVAGKKLKSKTCWIDYEGKSGGGTDEFGFSAMPGGSGGYLRFYNVGSYGYWWSATEGGSSGAYVRYMSYYYDEVNENNHTKVDRRSARCVRD